MRRLHVVGKHERFVASGVYHHYQNGQQNGLVEYWSIHEIGGAQFIRIDRDGRMDDGRSVLYEALRSPEGGIERVDVRAYGNSTDLIRHVNASCIFFDDRVEIIRVVNSNERFEDEVIVPPGYVIDMQASILRGFTTRQREKAAARPVVAFALDYDFSDVSETFKGAAREICQMEVIDTTSINIAGRPVEAHTYQSVDCRDTPVQILLDRWDVLLAQRDPQLMITLTQYARRPEPDA